MVCCMEFHCCYEKNMSNILYFYEISYLLRNPIIMFCSHFLDSRKYSAFLSENVPEFAKIMIFFMEFYFCYQTLMEFRSKSQISWKKPYFLYIRRYFAFLAGNVPELAKSLVSFLEFQYCYETLM